ncbi:Rrf2 family transcriptional regulator [Actinomadura nitritigenes]|uniref:Rrf2 family transcriptional regulator n=1 Tax=Actinomadura nitritigenes TaxID=134602 RepID=A0ABS3RCW1_9ACTN|nr:Rrf2 family transcriptional regulator [Actinomadura nitritigenes]MBO2444074.1 Rrf2 family transcriptional regulator [Actinomadura nitritigenes]
MRIGEGVEWAAHCLLLLDWMGEDRPVPTARLAAGFELPPPYLNKQLQALVKAGLVTSTPGARGGFRLARPLEKITMMDVVAAIEGPEEAFQCTEIRERGVGAGTPASVLRRPCAVSTAMRKAELAWRRALAEQTLADVSAAVKRGVPEIEDNVRAWYARN